MAHSDTGAGRYRPGRSRSGRVADLGYRVGTALVGAALPALVAVLAAVAVREGLTAPVSWVRGAMATSLVGASGLGWAFHVAALTGLVGVCALALALVCDHVVGR